jgi:hypothetical protein
VARIPFSKVHILTLEWKKKLKTNVELALRGDKSTNKGHRKGYPSK